MSRFSSLLAVALVLSVMAPASVLSAENTYTINTQPIPLRLRPSESGKVITMVPPSSTVERASENSYSLVIFRTPDGKTKRGWMLSKFVSDVPSDSSQVQQLTAQNEALKAQITQLQNDGFAVSQKEKELNDKLSALTAAYEKLKAGSANYLKLKTEYDSTKAGLERAGKTIQILTQKNEDLKLYHKIQWFLAGVLVLILGWLMGWSSSRWRSRKKRHSYYL